MPRKAKRSSLAKSSRTPVSRQKRAGTPKQISEPLTSKGARIPKLPPPVELADVTNLQPPSRNTRTHSKRQIGQIANSIRHFGWTYPILTDENRRIIAGSGRFKAAEQLGLRNVPVIVMTGLNEAEKRALALADNKIAANAGWDRAILAAELGELEEIGAAERITQPIGDLRAGGLKDAHHVIQDAAVRDLPGYNTNAAPGVQLEGPSTAIGSPHYNATQVQRLTGGGTYGAEREIGRDALLAAGYSEAEAAQAIAEADAYFESIGVTLDTPTRIPGNR